MIRIYTDSQGGVYQKGYEFERFFNNASCFNGVVISISGANTRRVCFDDDKHWISTVSMGELDQLCEEPVMGEVGMTILGGHW